MTAVQEDQLPSLNRLRVARKVIETLRPAIERAQGRLGPEEVSIDQNQGISHPYRTRSLRQPHARGHQIRHDDGTVHLMAFGLILTGWHSDRHPSSLSHRNHDWCFLCVDANILHSCHCRPCKTA